MGQRLRAVVEQREDLVGVEGQLVGHPQVEHPVQDRPRLGRRAERDRRVGPGAVAEAVRGVGAGLGPQQGRVGEVGGVVRGVHLQHESYGAGDQLLLVGLDAERDRDELGPVVAPARPQSRDALLQALAELVGAVRRSSGGGRPA